MVEIYTLMVNEHRGFVYNGHLREPVTRMLIAERLAVWLSLPV